MCNWLFFSFAKCTSNRQNEYLEILFSSEGTYIAWTSSDFYTARKDIYFCGLTGSTSHCYRLSQSHFNFCEFRVALVCPTCFYIWFLSIRKKRTRKRVILTFILPNDDYIVVLVKQMKTMKAINFSTSYYLLMGWVSISSKIPIFCFRSQLDNASSLVPPIRTWKSWWGEIDETFF